MFVFPGALAKESEPNPFAVGKDVLNGSELRQKKRDAAADTHWQEGQRYGEPVLSVGRKAGGSFLGSMPSPDVRLSLIHVINQINNLIQ